MKRPQVEFMTLVLYEHPRDFPRHIVARWHYSIGTPAAIACLYDTRKEAGDDVWAHWPALIWIERLPEDDPVILGVWV